VPDTRSNQIKHIYQIKSNKAQNTRSNQIKHKIKHKNQKQNQTQNRAQEHTPNQTVTQTPRQTPNRITSNTVKSSRPAVVRLTLKRRWKEQEDTCVSRTFERQRACFLDLFIFSEA
jgi:hypothetical protein